MADAGHTDDGGPAFACAAENGHQEGMSLRDWFAGQALAGVQERYDRHGVPEYELKAMFGGRSGLRREEIISAVAYQQADAMLAQRKEEA